MLAQIEAAVELAVPSVTKAPLSAIDRDQTAGTAIPVMAEAERSTDPSAREGRTVEEVSVKSTLVERSLRESSVFVTDRVAPEVLF